MNEMIFVEDNCVIWLGWSDLLPVFASQGCWLPFLGPFRKSLETPRQDESWYLLRSVKSASSNTF